MSLDAVKVAEAARKKFETTPGNEFINDHWKWSEAKLIPAHDNVPSSVLIPAKYPSVSPDLVIANARDVSKLTQETTAAEKSQTQAFLSLKKWQLVMPTFDSWREDADKGFKSGDSDNILSRAARKSEFLNKYIADRSDFAMSVTYEGMVLHELSHKSGAHEYHAFDRQKNYEQAHHQLASPICQSQILADIALAYSPGELGRSVAEATKGDFKNPLYKAWQPGGSAVREVAQDMIGKLQAEGEKLKDGDPQLKVAGNAIQRLHELSYGTDDAKSKFIIGFAKAVAQMEAKTIAKGVGYSDKDIALMLTESKDVGLAKGLAFKSIRAAMIARSLELATHIYLSE